MPEQQHMIERMLITVSATRPALAAQLQQQLGYRLHTGGLLRQLQVLLDNLVKEEEYVEIPQLVISLDCADETDFHTQFVAQLTQAIQEQLRGKTMDSKTGEKATEGIVLQSSEAYATTVRLFFLKYGIRAFFHGKDMLTALHRELQELPERELPALEQLLKKAGREAPVVWQRLYYILGAIGMKQFFLRTFACNEKRLQVLLKEVLVKPEKRMAGIAVGTTGGVTRTSSQQEYTGDVPDTLLKDGALWQALFQRMLTDEKRIDQIERMSVEQAFPHVQEAAAKGSLSQAATERELTAQLQQGFYIENAGLVLLWMECGRLFRTLGYVADRQFISEAAQQQAILLLHYIFCGTTEGVEEAWLLNKLLCVWPLHLPVDPALAPDEAAQQAADEMLSAYLEGWRKDRKFSAAWFRTAFLQREGRLYSRPDGHWMLEVHSRTEDILINKVSMVRYTWMSKILFVQW
jgi:hypothetical protein